MRRHHKKLLFYNRQLNIQKLFMVGWFQICQFDHIKQADGLLPTGVILQ